MLNFDELFMLAKTCGFTHAGALDVSTLEFLSEVRDMCASDKCRNYNRSWSCPPATGTLEAMKERASKFKSGILVQTAGALEDSYDFEAMQETAKKQSDNFQRLWDKLEPLYPNLFPMGSGGCVKCEKCTYPDEPCRFPDRLMSSMEACGLLVSKVCIANGMKYNHGPDTIAYTGCFLLE